MIDFAQARQIALAHLDEDCALVEEATCEKPYGWYFCPQSKEFVRTRNRRDSMIGSCGFIVEREDGRVFDFGSAYPLETWFANYEKGFKYDWYDLTITSVRDLATTVRFLRRLDMFLEAPELSNGISATVERRYRWAEISMLLGQLPCTFRKQSFWHRVPELDAITACACCTYELREHVPVHQSAV